jgi:hypothetical protein
MRVKHSTRNWRLILLMTILAGAIGLTSADGGAPTGKASQAVARHDVASGSQIAKNAATVSRGDAGSIAEETSAGEPQPPDLLDVTRDASDSQGVRVTVRAGMTANARLEITADQGMTWVGESAPTGLRLQRGGAPRQFAFRTKSNRSDRPNRASARLRLLDERGRVVLTYDKTLDLGKNAVGTTRTLARASAFSTPSAVDGQGEPVIVVVPKNVPTPILTEAGR